MAVSTSIFEGIARSEDCPDWAAGAAVMLVLTPALAGPGCHRHSLRSNLVAGRQLTRTVPLLDCAACRSMLAAPVVSLAVFGGTLTDAGLLIRAG
ncbi:hypothetical protein WJX81_007046 [Elliptochloris bilobata]|uniref:DUF2946 domain-containing protein n=1 Tax=Elliptochloris bilobata TaxID=381761 RepID=A0AAW1QZ12_9CHLO